MEGSRSIHHLQSTGNDVDVCVCDERGSEFQLNNTLLHKLVRSSSAKTFRKTFKSFHSSDVYKYKRAVLYKTT